MDLITKGLPKGSYGATKRYIAEYYLKRDPTGAVMEFEIPNLQRYIKVTDKYDFKTRPDLNGISFFLKKKPQNQRFINISQ